MALFQFIDETGKEWEDFMSIAAKAEYLSKNPNIRQVICAPAIISGVGDIMSKTSSGFNDVLGKIAQANPTSPLASAYGDKGIKAVKTREAVNKHRPK